MRPSKRIRFMAESVDDPLAAITSRSLIDSVNEPQEPTRIRVFTPYSLINSWA